jgi:excisionase family DNA binding protein
MKDTESAASLAVAIAKKRGLLEVKPDELLLGCLHAISQFGTVQLGDWTIDLETLGVDWLSSPEPNGAKVIAYSQAVVDIFDLAARIATREESGIHVEHLLAAFAAEETGLMRELKRTHGMTSGSWRAAIAKLSSGRPDAKAKESRTGFSQTGTVRDYLSPEEAAEALGVHVQTLRGYVRSGKLPALRLAGERAIRIRRTDLDKLLEPLLPEA